MHANWKVLNSQEYYMSIYETVLQSTLLCLFKNVLKSALLALKNLRNDSINNGKEVRKLFRDLLLCNNKFVSVKRWQEYTFYGK